MKSGAATTPVTPFKATEAASNTAMSTKDWTVPHDSDSAGGLTVENFLVTAIAEGRMRPQRICVDASIRRRIEGRRPILQQPCELGSIDDENAQLFRLPELGAGSWSGRNEVGLLRHAGSRLAPGSDDRLNGALPAEPLQAAGRDNRQPFERTASRGRRPGASVPWRRELHTGIRPPLHDLSVPIHLEPLDERVGDDPTHPIDRGQLVTRRIADLVKRPEVVGQRPRRHRTDMADVQAHENAPQRFRLGLLDLGQQLDRAGRRLRAGKSVLLLCGARVASEWGAHLRLPLF